jgi:ribosomal protein L11 methyltransferase
MDGWTAVTVTAPAEMEDALGSFLMDQGAPGLEVSRDDGAVEVTAHFAGAAPVEVIERFCDLLPDLFPGCRRPRVGSRPVSDENWAENWKDHFPPLSIGERLYVHPPWVRTIPAGRTGIEIDPGMAFGTGHHPSTRGCLCLLEAVLRDRPGSRVLDLGTGSGILAIAASKLGAGEVWAVDTDADACRIATENAERNGVGPLVHVAGDLDAVSGRFDLVIANLFAPQLVALAERIFVLLRDGAVAIGSGVLESEAAAVRRAWQAAGLTAHAEHAEEGWVTLAFRRKASHR